MTNADYICRANGKFDLSLFHTL